MSLQRAIAQQRIALETAGHEVAARSMTEACERCCKRGHRPHEPDFVASLFAIGTGLLENRWRPLLGQCGVQIHIGAVFCHQSPLVEFWSPGGLDRCELGDLMYVHSHCRPTGEWSRTALLYQAKVSREQPLRVGAGPQLDLYTKWPTFEYVRSGPDLNGKGRSVTPSCQSAGAQYLLIDDRAQASTAPPGPGAYPMGSCIADEYLCPHADLGSALVRLLGFATGRPFDSLAETERRGDQGWSRVVWDLIIAAARKCFRRSRSGFFMEPRASGDLRPDELDGCMVRGRRFHDEEARGVTIIFVVSAAASEEGK